MTIDKIAIQSIPQSETWYVKVTWDDGYMSTVFASESVFAACRVAADIRGGTFNVGNVKRWAN